MGKAQKLFENWAGNVPKEARIQDVKTFLNSYFPDMWEQKKSSHIVVRCEALKAYPEYQPYGELSVPIKGGQKVKGLYIKQLIVAAQLLADSGDAI